MPRKLNHRPPSSKNAYKYLIQAKVTILCHDIGIVIHSRNRWKVAVNVSCRIV